MEYESVQAYSRRGSANSSYTRRTPRRTQRRRGNSQAGIHRAALIEAGHRSQSLLCWSGTSTFPEFVLDRNFRMGVLRRVTDFVRGSIMRSVSFAVLCMMVVLSSARADEPRAFLGKTVEGWREILRSNAATPDDRRQAIWAVGCFGPEARSAAPDLIALVHQGEFKDEAIGALTAIGANPELAVPRLIATFIKEGCLHRTAAGAIAFNPGTEDALVHIGGPAVPALLGIFQGPNREMRVCAAAALGRIGPAARLAIPALIHVTESPENDHLAEILRRHAVVALGQIGPEARAIVPTLERLFEKNRKSEFVWQGPEAV